MAKLVLCSRRSGGRRCGRRESAGVRRHDAESRADPPLRIRVGRSRRSRARRTDARSREGVSHVHRCQSEIGCDARGHLAKPAAGHASPRRARAWRAGRRRRWRRGCRYGYRRRPRARPRRPDSVHAVAARSIAGRRRRHAGVRDESRRNRDGSGRFRDDRHGVVHDRRASRRQRPGVSGRCRARQGQERRRARDDLRPP